MADTLRQKYTVLVPFPKGGGHYSRKGEELELLDVQAQQLEAAGRIKLTAEIAAEAASAAQTAKKPTVKAD
ncbi:MULTISPECIES: hypothetical protein [Pseudomonas syringae group]|uniref:hypothetical protein n=1 Tax=Pseudomonas syringae group TaxID=136849 RepID=UPI000F01CC62|nr:MULTISPECIES: hypothetical protein [Pseudomonas syringae group]RXU07003.1 hypothetical protein B1F68_10345 [Pseudomonas syringae]RXU07024.1 hypothetical protein B1F68_10460 [Pseudomonas syringae]